MDKPVVDVQPDRSDAVVLAMNSETTQALAEEPHTAFVVSHCPFKVAYVSYGVSIPAAFSTQSQTCKPDG